MGDEVHHGHRDASAPGIQVGLPLRDPVRLPARLPGQRLRLLDRRLVVGGFWELCPHQCRFRFARMGRGSRLRSRQCGFQQRRGLPMCGCRFDQATRRHLQLDDRLGCLARHGDHAGICQESDRGHPLRLPLHRSPHGQSRLQARRSSDRRCQQGRAPCEGNRTPRKKPRHAPGLHRAQGPHQACVDVLQTRLLPQWQRWGRCRAGQRRRSRRRR